MCNRQVGKTLASFAVAVCLLAMMPATDAAEPASSPTVSASRTAPAAKASSGDEAIDNAVAAVVVAALTRQFGDEAISVRLDSVDVGISSVRDRTVSGEGRMRIGDDPDWVPFRYRTLYDTTFASAGHPELTFGGIGSGERELPNDAALVRDLDARVVAELDKQFGAGARLQLDRISTVEAGKRFLRIDASGVADFGLNGTTPIRIESLYDVAKSAWQRVNYDLGSAATR